MRELAFAGLTDTGDLLLTSGDGQQYSVAVEDRLVAAVRGDRPRLGQLSIALEGATPRDIQARVRHGQSPEQIAEQTGIALERIERYAGPPLAERAHIAEQAGATQVRGHESTSTMLELVLASLARAGVDDHTLEWDSWRREDGRWTVLARWDGGDGDLAPGVAGWTYDHTDRTIIPDDGAARALQRVPDAPAEPDPPRMHLVVTDDVPVDLDGPASPWGEPTPAEIDRQVHAWGDGVDQDAALTAVVDRYSGEVVDLASGPPEEPDTPLDDLLLTDPGVQRSHGRASRRERRKPARSATRDGEATRTANKPRSVVPTWDEILFGARRPDSTD